MRIIIDSFLRRISIPVLAVLLLGATASADPGVYQSPDAFVEQAFSGEAPDARALWLRAELRDAVSDVLGHAPAPRVRYWRRDGQTVWILDEVGKEKPITAGVVVREGAIDDIRVLVFRESRGWEVKHTFFTRQFEDARLTSDGELSRSIDGITGATLSVRAMKKMARVALLLDAHARSKTTELAGAHTEPRAQR